jgi:hypothetical protein
MTAQLRPCGTPAAYKRHLRHREPPCDDCTAANRLSSRLHHAGNAAARIDILFAEVLGVIAAECRRKGMLP